MIGRRRCEKQQPDSSRDIPARDSAMSPALDGDIRQRFIGGSVTSGLDTGAPLDPTGFEAEARLDLGVGDDPLRRVMAVADDLHAAHASTSSSVSVSALYTDLSSSLVVQ